LPSISSQIAMISPVITSLSALRRSGAFSVTTATLPSISRRTSLI